MNSKKKHSNLLILILLLLVATVSCKVSGPEATGSVTFNPNGENVKGTMVEQVFLNKMTQKLYTNTFSRAGYVFKGWNTNSDGSGASYADKAEFTYNSRESNIVLYAQWTENQTYTVEFIDSFDPSAPHKTQTISCGVATNLDTVEILEFVHEKNPFVEWVSEDGKKTFSNGQIIKDLVGPGETIKLNSRWVATIKFFPNGVNIVGEVKDQYFITTKPVVLRENKYGSLSEIFVGWYTKSDYKDQEGTFYIDCSKIENLNSDLSLYAIWMEPKQIITISKNTVIDNREEETVKTVEELGDGNKYVMISDGPIYNSECKEVTEKISDNLYIAYTAGILTDTGDVYYRTHGKKVQVIHTIPNGKWVDTLPSRNEMEKWGNPSGTHEGKDKMDVRLLKSFLKEPSREDMWAWSGTSENSDQAWAVSTSTALWGWNFYKKNNSLLFRFQTAEFKW